MKHFIAIENRSYLFSSCEGCPAKCCDGKEGSIYSELLLEEFEQVSEHFPILFSFGDLGFLKANILLSNGKGFCPYIENHRCTIYENRPNVCRNYPLSSTIENKIYIDDNCPAVNQEFGQVIINHGKVEKGFENQALYHYQTRFLQTHYYLEEYKDKDNFELVVTINGLEFYKLKQDFDQRYLQLHIKSLVHLDKVLED